MTLAAGPPEEVAESARAGLRAGYACFKLKVGLPDDAERVAAVREAIGPWPALRVDANGAWSVDEAVPRSASIEEHDLEFVEQPCRTLARARRGARSACRRRSPPTSRSARCASCAAPSSSRRATW
jgi:L-alanine-DL-glutamate epimerase-like enolase superfamily enzyme